jgi:4,5-DOPA dioxygenase extradiol
LYQIKYPAKGSVAIAEILEERFKRNGIQMQREQKRGLDHGSWVALKHMYPNADIPVVQLSVHPYLSPKEQHRIGRALQGLGAENILVVGSGHTVHNLRWFFPNATEPKAEVVDFDEWIIDKVQKRDIESLDRYTELAPNARLAVHRPEHFVPLFLAMGSGDENKAPVVIHRSYAFGTSSNLCFEF